VTDNYIQWQKEISSTLIVRIILEWSSFSVLPSNNVVLKLQLVSLKSDAPDPQKMINPQEAAALYGIISVYITKLIPNNAQWELQV